MRYIYLLLLYVNLPLKNKKKIAFVIYSLGSGGAERVISILTNELANDYNITIITFYKCDPFYSLHENVNLEYCCETFVNTRSIWQSINNHFNLFYRLNKIVKRNKIDIYIGFMTISNIYVSLLSKLHGKPSIISERIHPEYYQISKFWNFARKKTYPMATKLVVQTKSIKRYFEKFIKTEQIVIIKNPIAPEFVIKRNLNNTKQNIILNVGRLDDQKNQDLLIKAFANIENDSWILYIIGEGVNRNAYENLIRSLNVEGKVKLLGNTKEIDSYYNQSSVFVFSSRFEGFPNALTEAMFFGIPSISTDCPSGPSELITDGYNGFLIPVGDQRALEKQLQKLMNDSCLRARFSENSIKTTKEFQSSAIANQWRSIIEELLCY